VGTAAGLGIDVDAPALERPDSIDLARARRVLATEAAGLAALAEALDSRLDQALDRLAGATGRVVVSGMGKSGHVGRKIAATLASTGTPALFVHPAEASHGDLGMIGQGDAVLALSNSGETPELGNLIAYTRRFAIPLVAIVGRAPSTLADAADVALVLPPAPEACPLGLAPTTSTTMALALGDALAVALLERRGFTAEHFSLLHPGGRLGRKLLRVADLMHAGDEVPLAPPGTRVSEAIVAMTAKRFGCLGLVDPAGRLVGIITDGDLRRHMSADLLARTAGEIMTHRPKTIRPDALAGEALRLMNEKSITALFVVPDSGPDAGKPVGIVHLHDCLRAGVA
jgi:arabinose-5-phosphate isomerase